MKCTVEPEGLHKNFHVLIIVLLQFLDLLELSALIPEIIILAS